ncbi:MAG: hypothetical protein A2W82_05485 [Sulfurimonas sp. RIFCSPLOWO2_12_36_12]|uniref:helix-turn-helix domain-containing protein n=1 Tax=Sulfurimonas sp. RIFCSPLOWO2_12_36_12 TaxID=1802253 RepID=UPI0008B75502|nr:helix-turn-helix domain-containing protein [Sulfurimonas sp. RIFCSPLOWO2_12_36_12]OHD99621.1 MAG: hypothetical protein A3J26_07855 [Sulfurimonas sp. RIFCSPLOWO2_02_FULL_36_28]OHE01382.1 MAG: hypothetical protein A2W82_05485 [Sulfurimonas sp. RIFCSPLOWO2_12_36_12]
MEKQYYTTEEVSQGIDGLLPISKTTLRNGRQKRIIKFSKIGNQCVYKREWIEDYINRNVVEVAS